MGCRVMQRPFIFMVICIKKVKEGNLKCAFLHMLESFVCL